MVGDVGLRLVVRRHLQVASRLEVDGPDLDAPHLATLDHRQGLALAPTAGQGPHQLVGVEDRRPEPIELVARGTRAHRTAARTTMRMRAPNATGMTSRRWWGFMTSS